MVEPRCIACSGRPATADHNNDFVAAILSAMAVTNWQSVVFGGQSRIA
jgi:hypothetical protein